MTAEERAIPPAQLPAAARQRIAAAAGVTVGEVGDALAKFAWTAAAMKHMAQLKAEGKPMPTSFDNLEVRAEASMYLSVDALC
jgi:signal recognition particle GTPase